MKDEKAREKATAVAIFKRRHGEDVDICELRNYEDGIGAMISGMDRRGSWTTPDVCKWKEIHDEMAKPQKPMQDAMDDQHVRDFVALPGSAEEVVTHVLRVAGVLESLPLVPHPVEEIARLCKLDPGETKIICDFLCAAGVLMCSITRSAVGYSWIEQTNEGTNK